MGKTKKSGFIVFTLIMIVVIVFTAVLFKFTYKGSNKNPNLDIGGNIIDMPSDKDNSENYLALITQYSKQVSELKSQITSLQAEKDKQLAAKNEEIARLEEELANSQNQDADIIAAKNARINALKEAILTLEEETASAVSSYETRIAALNSSLSEYEKEVVSTVSLPSDFKFTELGFQIIENDNFIFYSKSHSCNLYYFNYKTKTLTAIPVKGVSFDSFYQKYNKLFFKSGTTLYNYDFNEKSLVVMGSSLYSLSYVSDDNHIYMFNGTGSYAIYNLGSGEFTNLLSLRSPRPGYLPGNAQPFMIDHYILHSASYYLSSKEFSLIELFDIETQENHVVFEQASRIYSFTKFKNQYIFSCYKGFYSIDVTDFSTTSLSDVFDPIFVESFDLGEAVLFRGSRGLYLYDGTSFETLKTIGSSSISEPFLCLKITNDIYYLSQRTGLPGLYKFEVSSKTLTELSSDLCSYFEFTKVGHRAFVYSSGGFYNVDLNSGSFETCVFFPSSTSSKDSFNILENDNYVVIYLGSSHGYCSVFYYDKSSDVSGYLASKNFFHNLKVKCSFKNDILYVLTNDALYTYNLDASAEYYVTKLSVDGTLSNVEKGIFYSEIGSVSEGKLYVRSYLKDDGTFEKEFVVIKND